MRCSKSCFLAKLVGMNIPNFLTLLRLAISPLFLMVYIYREKGGMAVQTIPYVLLFLFFISELSDLFDGMIARRYKQVTELGKILDPMADSIARTAAFLAFIAPPVELPIVIAFVMIYRDSVLSTLRTICAFRGYALAARNSGKIKAVIQAAVIFSILLLMIAQQSGAISLEELRWTSALLASIAALYTVLSGVEYIMANWTFITRSVNLSH